MKIVIKPNSMRQWLDWTERLDDAGVAWKAIPSPNKKATTEQGALSSILLKKVDAENILGVTHFENLRN